MSYIDRLVGLVLLLYDGKGVLENKNREIAVLTKQLNTARDQVAALKSSVTNLTNEKVRPSQSSRVKCCSIKYIITRQLQREQPCKKKDRFLKERSSAKKHINLYSKLRELQKQIEEMQKRVEFKSSLERSFDSLQVRCAMCTA